MARDIEEKWIENNKNKTEFLEFGFKNKVERNERLERQLIELINKEEIFKYLSLTIQKNGRAVEDGAR